MSHPQSVKDWVQISVLGSGSFGTVMLWRNIVTGDFTAIKMCKFQMPDSLSKKQKERWQMEVDFLQSTNHKNVIGFKRLDTVLAEMLDKFNPTRLPLLSMEYCTKGNLRRYLTNEPIKLCGLQETDIRYILEDISSGLDYLHKRNITHRDIKPDNIVLQHCNNRRGQTVYKIIDLGYAKELNDNTLSFVGTLHYLAPEIFEKKTYDRRVDYWSMGVMVFEITCGSLPFLPELNPFERFARIKDKPAEAIWIYFLKSGSIMSSNTIKKETFVTKCFKEYIESWLRGVLQIDPGNRGFTDHLSPFDYLRFILDRKVIKVFSVYKQEYYSYEINDSTCFGTLKDWVSRDIGIPKTDLLFLFRTQDAFPESNKVWHFNEDNTLLANLFDNNNNNKEVILYVYKRDFLFCRGSPKSKIPNLVKELFNYKANFHQRTVRFVYRQALFYVYNKMYTTIGLKHAFLCLNEVIKDLFDETKKRYIKATIDYGQIFAKLDQLSDKSTNDRINYELELGQEWRECLKYLEILFSHVDKLSPKLKDFRKQFKIFEMIQKTDRSPQKIAEIFQKWDVQPWFDRINGIGFLEKTINEEPPNLIQLRPIRDIVSEAIKMEYKLLVEEDKLKGYFKDVCKIIKWSQDLFLWADNFVANIHKLITYVDAVQNKYDQIIREAMKNAKLEFPVLHNTNEIIHENEILRCKFADLLAEQMTSHKNFVDESGSYFEDLK
ncbi:unnamed protein product [Ceutorhynchus assimilis]|uniref:IkappaB kinase n=1 Tax=Ceutorhynchus assimilis TaxID=467358 RepID=A0A9N9MA76_9CUCU|nr:unnamed protein product [Ceutorhynchus assimilis]